MKQVHVVLLVAAVGALALMNYRLQRRLAEMDSAPVPVSAEASGEAARDPGLERLERELEGLRAENLSLLGQLEQVRQQQASPVSVESPAPQAPAGEAASGENPFAEIMKTMAEMMEKEGTQDMVVLQAESAVDVNYQPLFDYLHLPEAEQEAFRKVLVDRQLAQMKQGLDLMAGGDGQDDGETAVRNFDQELQALLGDERTALLKEYEQTEAERMQVHVFKMGLNDAEELEPEEERDLVSALHAARIDYEAVTAMYRADPSDLGVFSEETIARYEAEASELVEKQVLAAAEILDGKIAERFAEHLRQQLAMQLMGLRMAQEMMQGNVPEP